MADDDEFDPELWRLYEELDLGERWRIEFIEGRIVVSGVPCFWHARAVTWLIEHLLSCCRERGWELSIDNHLKLPPPARGIRPDLQVVRDPDALPQLDSDIPIPHVLLAAEVVSAGSKRTDRELKPLSCARAGVPLYLLIDRFTKPLTISLLSKPSADGYTGVDAVSAGPGGGKLHLPHPFDLTLDAVTIPVP
jgi:Uma2 family endonuclease